MELKKVRGDENPADILTKPKTAAEILPMVALAGGTVVRREREAGTDVGACGAECAPPWLSGVLHTARPWGGLGRDYVIDHLPLRDPRPEKFDGQNFERAPPDIGLRRKYPGYLADRVGWLESAGPDVFADSHAWILEASTTAEEEMVEHGLPLLSLESLLVNPRKMKVVHSGIDFGELSSFAGARRKWADEFDE